MQIGLLRCGLDENEDAKMARFLGGLNREIQDILDYKEFNSITRLFHLACKAEREVQGRYSKLRGSFGGASSSRLNQTKSPSTTAGREHPLTNHGRPTASTPTPSHVSEQKSTTVQAATKSASSVASTGRTRDVQCHRCKGFGHVMRICPNQRALIVREDGEYTSASENEEDLVFAATNSAGQNQENEYEEEHSGAET